VAVELEEVTLMLVLLEQLILEVVEVVQTKHKPLVLEVLV
jgi:hypothetical protein